MKIPNAYTDGSLGQRVVTPTPSFVVDNTTGPMIAQAGANLSRALFAEAERRNEYQGKIDLMRAQEHAAELKQMAAMNEEVAAKREYLNFTPALATLQQKIIDDPDTPPEAYPVKLREEALRMANEGLFTKLNDRQRLRIEPITLEHINKQMDQISKIGKEKLNNSAWAGTLSTLDALVNDPTRDARTKIHIIRDDNLFANTGRTAVEIETEKERRIATVTENAVQSIFNDRGPAAAKKFLEAKNSDGTYTNLPELHIDKREAYRDHANDEIRRLEGEARREARERKALADQQTHNLFESVKTMLDDGYPLPAKIDVQARMAFKGTRYEPLYATVKEKANSLEYRTTLINKDALLYFARSKGYNIPPLDITNPATIPQQIAARAVFAKEAQKALNLPYVPYFFTGEQKAIGQQLEALDGSNRVRATKVWSDVLGSKNMTQFAKQVSGDHSDDPGKNTALALEIALAANGKETAAHWVASGRDYLRRAKIAEPARQAQNKAFEAIAGSALKGLKQGRDDYRDAVNSAFVYLAKTRGMDVENEKNLSSPGWFSSGSDAWKLYNQAFKAVVGETTYHNGKTTIIPTGMSKDGFLNSIKRITPDTVTAAGGVKGLTPDRAAQLLRSEATLWENGEGVYSFQLGERQLKTDSGKIFKLRFQP